MLQALEELALLVGGAGALIVPIVPDAHEGDILAGDVLGLAEERLLSAGALIVGGNQPAGKIRGGLRIIQPEFL